MEPEAWYSAQDMLPPLRVRVRVYWAGRQFEATRIVHPKRKVLAWATIRNGELEYLPPKGRSRIWGDNPDHWQPMDPATWPHPLPAPCAPSRPIQRALAIPSSDEHARNPMWWRDATAVSYAPPGAITRREAEGRLMRALNTNWRIKVDGPRFSSNADVLARLSAERFVADDGSPVTFDWRVPFEPLGADFDDFLVAMGWFAALNPREMWSKNRKMGAMNRNQMVLVFRAMDPPSSWSFIGTRWGVSGERVRQIYSASLDKLQRAANGLEVYRHLRVRDPLADIRERKRRHASEDTY
jgi:hypothetical protein